MSTEPETVSTDTEADQHDHDDTGQAAHDSNPRRPDPTVVVTIKFTITTSTGRTP